MKISFAGLHGHIASGLALLIAAVGGAAVAAIFGSIRIAQLRRTARRHNRQDRSSLDAAGGQPLEGAGTARRQQTVSAGR